MIFTQRRNRHSYQGNFPVPFYKMHGLGNDFVLLDARRNPERIPDALAASRIASRRYGIGCDQLLVLRKALHEEDAFDMIIFNPDGSQAQACGNGTRCAARYVFERDRRFRIMQSLSLRVAGRRLSVRRLSPRMFSVDMGKPRFSASALNLTKPCNPASLPLGLKVKGYENAFGVNVGNPHAVFFCAKSDREIKRDLLRHGAKLEQDPLFGEGANISFARIDSRTAITLFVWERVAGNTRACGSAACATLVAALCRGLLHREACVRLEGGTLLLAWRDDESGIEMTGSADHAFCGTTHLLS